MSEKKIDEILGLVKGIMEKTSSTDAKVAEMSQTLSSLARDLSDVREEQADQKFRIDIMDRKLRRKNLLFCGIEEGGQTEDAEGRVLQIIQQDMGCELTADMIETAYRIGPPGPGKIRPILVEFGSSKTKEKVFAARTNIASETTYVKLDLPLRFRKSQQTQSGNRKRKPVSPVGSNEHKKPNTATA